jgi:hypothetical protein
MLKRILMTITLAICGIVGVHASEKCEESEKNLTAGVLVCNSKEDKCVNEEDQKESSSSALFSVFCGDDEEIVHLFACKDCQ